MARALFFNALKNFLWASCRKNDAERVIRKMVAAHVLQEVTTRQDNQYGSVVRRPQLVYSRTKIAIHRSGQWTRGHTPCQPPSFPWEE